MIKRGLAVLVLAAIVLPLSLNGQAKRVPIDREDMVGTWIGLTEDELQMIRLTLSNDGRGTIGFSFMDEEPCVFRIDSWTYSRGRMDFELSGTVDRCPKDRKFHGVAKGNALELSVLGEGWKRKASLRQEGDLANRWQRLKVVMDSAR